ncbi:hypothetical protein Bca52824_009367 [Brassica carinata]|uniref:Uncharacterized protein n=1 Tax=Brassica carinata TaxID=52824 RepID=A0A8X7W9S8_BRACI|nr:hypothetical protein Bca52824_009367 [Brassica carinata]
MSFLDMHWDNLYNKRNIKVGVALLNTLVGEWKDHSLKLPSSPSDIVILRHTMKSLRLKVMPISLPTSLLISSLTFTCACFLRTKKAITERGEEASPFKEADKYSKVIYGETQ